MNYRMLLLPAGDVPPAGGPARENFLRLNGEQSLRDAVVGYRAVTDTLQLDSVPVENFFTEEPLDEEAVDGLHREWARIRNSLDKDELAKQRDLIERSVKQSVRALNFLEDTDLADEAHAWVHRTARLEAGLYGCVLWVEDDEVWSDCAVRISHERWGVSVEMTTVWNCSICGTRFDSCPHDPDTTYDVVVTRPTGRECSACPEVDCDHEDGDVVRTSPFPVAASISAGAVAVVERPRYPDARPICVALPVAPGSEVFRSALEGDLSCDLCLKPCPGWSHMRRE